MDTFNNTTNLSGYIKQLLHSFNLPTIKIPVENEWLVKNNYYLYKGKIRKAKETVEATGDDFTDLFYKNNTITYIYNKSFDNFTKNLIIENNEYDSYTHKYLGEYLRFQRDYNNLDLMSLYNCFSNEMPKYMRLNLDGIEFNTEDNLYKIYMVPVKFFKNYTIAIDADSTVEVACGFYDKKLFDLGDADNEPIWYSGYTSLIKQTYTKLTGVNFNNPTLYSNLTELSIDFTTYPHLLELEKHLKLFIKLPVKNTSSITILEGNYTASNNYIIEDGNYKYNYSVSNYVSYEDEEPVPNENINKINLINRCQLLDMNCGRNHPFADRLVEYLVDNAITHLDDISDNIKRLQQKLIERNREGKLGIPSVKYNGIWEDKYKNILYDIAVQNGLTNTQSDILGYCDKDVEKILGKDIDIYNISDTKKKYDKIGGKK